MMPSLAEEFDRLWEDADGIPDVFAFLAEHSDASSVDEISVLRRDQHHRWRAGQPLQTEEYLTRLPHLREDKVAVCKLASGEFTERQRNDRSVSIGDFVERFPDVREQLFMALSDEQTQIEGDLDNTSDANNAFLHTTAGSPDSQPLHRIGRYALLKLIGEGGYGHVHLGYDEELQREVAIKFPTDAKLVNPKHAQLYLDEARMVASLDHPHIVPVHDVGRTPDGAVYVVSKFIPGVTLHDLIQNNRPDAGGAAELLAPIARALQHSHDRRIVHRDVKPKNILIDEKTGKAFLADFGLAKRDADYLRGAIVAGTPLYMSPEQARGEGHRLDGRSDVFSLGIVFYFALTGKRPFRGGTSREVLHQIVSTNPIPPRDYDDSIPAELERICLKSLEKRRSDRYQSAAEMADDLEEWQSRATGKSGSAPIIPRGLRSFDSDDSDFFLDLLPGPRNRDGLPDSILFWRNRIQDRDPDTTFTVGLIYGPSGCGKSSLVKAGLLPQISRDILPVYIEATATDTEKRLANRIHRVVPGLDRSLDLPALFSELRSREQDEKVLVVIDQFEQWLASHPDPENAELVNAFRQSDGGNLQSIVMVRDDFAMAAARFMDALDVPIAQGVNFATVDLFDQQHARYLLHQFGKAYGKVPAKQDELSDAQRAFLNKATNALTVDGKVVSVHLSLFAEMIKDKPWNETTLQTTGGAQGLGVSFLEDTFGNKGGNPKHLQHSDASRKVLNALLPDLTSDIKGHSRSEQDLQEIAGYQGNQNKFQSLLRVLDGELRLITPSDPEEIRSESNSSIPVNHYQLTHDYLVPSLRDWLTRKQSETRSGRAMLLLEERARVWEKSKHKRYLPSAGESISIACLTDSKSWSTSQAEMMGQARRVYGAGAVMAGVVAAITLFCVLFARQQIDRSRVLGSVDSNVSQLMVAGADTIPSIALALDSTPEYSRERLLAVANDEARSSSDRLRADIALVNQPGEPALRLIQSSLSADIEMFGAVVQRTTPFIGEMTNDLWRLAAKDRGDSGECLRLATLLARSDPNHLNWEDYGIRVADALITSNPSNVQRWRDYLVPVAKHLVPRLREHFEDKTLATIQRNQSTVLLGRYAGAEILTELMVDADAENFRRLFAGVRDKQSDVIARARQALEQLPKPSPRDDKERRRRRQEKRRNVVLTLMRLGDTKGLAPILADDEPTLRSMVMLAADEFGLTLQELLACYHSITDSTARQTLLLAMQPYKQIRGSETEVAEVSSLCHDIVRGGTDQATRSAASWLLQSWGENTTFVSKPYDELTADSDWFTTSQKHTMKVIRDPQQFTMGRSNSDSPWRRLEKPTEQTIPYDFAISIHEVTSEQWALFERSTNPDARTSVSTRPARASYMEAQKYCRWLSEQEGIPESEMCYDAEIGSKQAQLEPDRLLRTGFRLPTTAEWEYAARAQSKEDWYFGEMKSHLSHFGWFVENAKNTQPVGMLRPSPYGLFDIAGNVFEWCHAPAKSSSMFLRGGAYNQFAGPCGSASHYQNNGTGYSFTGFRVVQRIKTKGDK